jgi:ribose transport system ATP-binding protein
VSLELRPGEILGIGGVLGSGKTELGRAIAGVASTDAGELILADKVIRTVSLRRLMAEGVGYVPQERHVEGIILYLSLAFNLTLCSVDRLSARFPGFLNLRKEREIVEGFIKLLAIKSPSLSTLANSLSGGNQQKVVLAKWLARQPRILILDNPTRGVDAGAKEEIYVLLRRLSSQGIAIILITDELLELIGMSNRILVLRDGRVSYEVEAPPTLKPTEQELVRHMV